VPPIWLTGVGVVVCHFSGLDSRIFQAIGLSAAFTDSLGAAGGMQMR
jgi:hypothetical protein